MFSMADKHSPYSGLDGNILAAACELREEGALCELLGVVEAPSGTPYLCTSKGASLAFPGRASFSSLQDLEGVRVAEF